MIRIVLIDNHRLFRVSLKSLLNSFDNCQVILDVSEMREIAGNFEKKEVQLVIVDPGEMSDKAFELLKKSFPLARFMILTNITDARLVLEYMQGGISGFFSKKDCPQQLELAIGEFSTNYGFEEIRLGAEVRQLLIDDVGAKTRRKIDFSEREIQILKLVCMEKTNVEISNILGLSVRTIESHRRRMIDKSDCRSIIGVILNVLSLPKMNLMMLNKNSNQAS